MPKRHKLPRRRRLRKYATQRQVKVERMRAGLRNEQNVMRVFSIPFDAPAWFTEIRKATKEEDHHGVDFIITTDVGEIPLQLKSSDFGAQKFMRSPLYKDNPIPVAVATFLMPDHKVRNIVLEAVRKKRNMLLEAAA